MKEESHIAEAIKTLDNAKQHLDNAVASGILTVDINEIGEAYRRIESSKDILAKLIA